MNRIGFRMGGEVLPVVAECPVMPSEAVMDEFPETLVNRLLAAQFTKKAEHLANEYLHHNNPYGEAQLDKLRELKRAYFAMI